MCRRSRSRLSFGLRRRDRRRRARVADDDRVHRAVVSESAVGVAPEIEEAEAESAEDAEVGAEALDALEEA